MHAGQSGDDLAHLIVREDGRQAFVRAGANGVNRTGVRMQRLPIQKQKGSQRLILGGGGDAFVHCQMRQKSLNLSDAHLIGVTFLMEENELPDPLHLCFFGSDRRVFQTNGGRRLVEEFGSMHGGDLVDSRMAAGYNRRESRQRPTCGERFGALTAMPAEPSALAFRHASLEGDYTECFRVR